MSLRSNEATEKEMSPKLIIFSVLFAGSAVKNCRTVLADNPVCPVVLSHMGLIGALARIIET